MKKSTTDKAVRHSDRTGLHMRGMYVRKKICEIAAPAMMQAADEAPSSRDEDSPR